jgi:hypothetical protein
MRENHVVHNTRFFFESALYQDCSMRGPLTPLVSLALALASACPDGTTSYGNYVTSLAGYWVDTSLYGAQIGMRSDGCSLPVTPAASTFHIWNYIYTHQSALSLPGQLTEEELYHLSQTFEATRNWLRTFTGAANADNYEAADAIDTMECHMRKASRSACDEHPRSAFACCALMQHYSWLRVASALQSTIADAYGVSCGSRRMSDAAIEEAFARRVGDIVATAPDDGVRGVARRTAHSVVAWAVRGACDRERDDCVALRNVSAVDRAAIHALQDQSDVAWAAALACPIEPAGL